MRRLIVPLLVVALFGGGELAARRLERSLPAPLIWDTQFSQDKAVQVDGLGDQLEVVFTGSSVAQANFDPALFVSLSSQFGTAYNTGLPAVTPRVWRQFMLDVVYPDYCPGLLVIGVDIRQFNDNKPGSIDQLNRYLSSVGRRDAVGDIDGWRRVERRLESMSALFRIRDRLREPDEVVARIWHWGHPGDWRNTHLTALGRYESNDQRTYEPSADRLDNMRAAAFHDLSFGGVETDALRGMVEDAEQRGAKVVLVEMPTMRATLAEALPNGEADQRWFTEVLTGVAEEYGIPLLRFPEMDNQEVYYSDEYHMNWTGVATLTTALEQRIAQLGLTTGSGVCADDGAGGTDR